MNIGKIIWPSNGKEAITLYLEFIIKVIDTCEVKFPSELKNPVDITKRYLKEVISVQEYRGSVNEWWDYIDNNNAIRNFSDKNILIARIAICLLSVTDKERSDLDNHLSWFLEVSDNFGVDSQLLRDLVYENFSF